MNARTLALLSLAIFALATSACSSARGGLEREPEPGTAWGTVEGEGAPRLTAESRRLLPGRMRTLYPPLLRDAGIMGTVDVRFTVTAEGDVDASSIRVSNMSDIEFEQPAWRVVRDLRWTPGTRAGSPEATAMTGRLRFDPRGSDASFRPARG